jgi:hypothetical protein
VICDASSLAFPVSEKWENLENPQLPNREEWFLKFFPKVCIKMAASGPESHKAAEDGGGAHGACQQ